MDKIIKDTISLIKEQTGLSLVLCDYFTGLNNCASGLYFNILLKQRTSESTEYTTLERFSKKYNSIKIEPNGLNRVAVFPL